MNSLDGEKSYLKGLKTQATNVKTTFGKDSGEYVKAIDAIKEQTKKVQWLQNRINSGEQKGCWPDYSGSIPSQIQARVEHEQKTVDRAPHWWEGGKDKEETKDEIVNHQECKFLVRETVQNIVHELCINPVILERNKQSNDGRIHCMAFCRAAEYDRHSDVEE